MSEGVIDDAAAAADDDDDEGDDDDSDDAAVERAVEGAIRGSCVGCERAKVSAVFVRRAGELRAPAAEESSGRTHCCCPNQHQRS